MPTPFFTPDKDTFVPDEIAHGGWGPTLGGQVVGGLLARTVEQKVTDPELVPARLTVDILRRVASEPVRVSVEVIRVGRRMQALDAVMTQRDEIVARASVLYLRSGAQPDGQPWTTPVQMPPLPDEPAEFDESLPMFIVPHGRTGPGPGMVWQHDGPRFAWVREIRDLVAGEEMSPFVRAAMAVDVTASMSNFSPAGLGFINADFTLTLCRLPIGPYIGLASLTHASAAGIATGTAAVYDAHGAIGAGVTTSAANPHFVGTQPKE